MPSAGEKYKPRCLFAHDLVNKLSAIIGYCDLLIDKAEEDTECAKRLRLIHKLAKSAAKELAEHECELSLVLPNTKAEKSRAVRTK